MTSLYVWIGAGMVCFATWPSPSSAFTNSKCLTNGWLAPSTLPTTTAVSAVVSSSWNW